MPRVSLIGRKHRAVTGHIHAGVIIEKRDTDALGEDRWSHVGALGRVLPKGETVEIPLPLLWGLLDLLDYGTPPK